MNDYKIWMEIMHLRVICISPIILYAYFAPKIIFALYMACTFFAFKLYLPRCGVSFAFLNKYII